MSRTDCLTPAELKAFHLGDLPETVLDEIAEHLENCPRCEAAAQATDSLSDPVIAGVRQSVATGAGSREAAPERVGDYEILNEVGRGGMGVVYRARHLRLGRVVALKMLLAGAFADHAERLRFRAEAEAIARLQHPNIVQIHEIGEHDTGSGVTRPYFTLEFVDGDSLADRLANGPQPVRQAASWLEPLAQAVHYAHERGVVHRDLKPANVLLTREGHPKLCDFGVAKLMAGSDFKTLSGMLLGTAEYMAPEQAAGKSDVGPPTDVYSLGAVLYAMLTGRPPFHGASTLQTLNQVQQHEPVPPTRLQPAVPRDLETICLKCLQKEPRQRYASAGELGEDLRRFLAGEPIVARPIGSLERTAKWVRRRPAVASLLAALVLVTAAGFGLVTWKWREADARALSEADAKRLAEDRGKQEQDARRAAERLSASGFLDQGVSHCEKGDVGHGMLWVVRALEAATRTGDKDLERVARINLNGWNRHLIRRRALLPHTSWVWAAAFSPDSRTVLTGSYDRTARLWDAGTGEPRGAPLRHPAPVWVVTFSPDGRTILTGCSDKLGPGEARLWDAGTGEPVGPPLPHAGRFIAGAFARDGKTFLTVSSQEARLWDARTCSPAGPPLRHQGPELVLLLSADPLGLTANAVAHEHFADVAAAALAPDGQTVVTGGGDGTARVWDAVTGRQRALPLPREGRVRAVAFSPDGQKILTGSWGGTAQIWETATGLPQGSPLRQSGPILTVAFSTDGTMAATGGMSKEKDPLTGGFRRAGGEACIWDLQSSQLRVPPMRYPYPVWAVAFHPAGHLLLTGCEDFTSRFFVTNTGELVDRLINSEGTVTAVAFSPDGRSAVGTSAGGGPSPAARLWEVRSERVFSSTFNHDRPITTLAFSRDGRALRTGSSDGTARLWDIATGRPLAKDEADFGVASAPEGLFFNAMEGTIQLKDRTGRELRDWKNPFRLSAVTQSPNGSIVAAGGQDRFVRLWDVTTGQPKGSPLPHQYEGVYALQFSPDSRSLMSGGFDRTARLWDVATGKPLGPPLSHPHTVRVVAFSPDGRHLATGCDDGRARIADVSLPVAGTVERIRLWVEVVTGMELDTAGAIRELDADTLRRRREQLDQLGGPPIAVAPVPATSPDLP